jgi:hypothetical protein
MFIRHEDWWIKIIIWDKWNRKYKFQLLKSSLIQQKRYIHPWFLYLPTADLNLNHTILHILHILFAQCHRFFHFFYSHTNSFFLPFILTYFWISLKLFWSNLPILAFCLKIIKSLNIFMVVVIFRFIQVNCWVF